MPFDHSRRSGASAGAPASTDNNNNGRELAVYWDFENLPLPSWATPTDASKAIVQAVSKYGRIVDRRLYFDMAAAANANANGNVSMSALDSSGFDLVNTPRRRNNQKETLDKKLIADVLTFAWDSAVRSGSSNKNDDNNLKPCVVLLTNDGDYAYTLSKLRDRGVMSVVMYGNDDNNNNNNSGDTSLLKSSADVPLSFEKDVLTPCIKQQQQQQNNNNGKANGDDLLQSSNPIDNARILCHAVARDLVKDTTHGTWILGSKVAVSFRTNFLLKTTGSATTTVDKHVIKEIYRKAREVAVKNGWLVHGRRSLQGSTEGQIVAPPSSNSNDGTTAGNSGNCNPQYWSLEDFLRVTLKGKVELENYNNNNINNTADNNNNNQSTTVSANASTNLFVKNVPTNSRIKDLVQYLEQEFAVVVLRGYTKKMHPNAQYMFASIQVETVQMGEHLCRLAGANRLKLNNRTLEVCFDRNVKTYSGPSEHYYDRQKQQQKATAAANNNNNKNKLDNNDQQQGAATYCKLFIKNVPRCTIHELVDYLEHEHHVIILQANVQKAHPKSAFQFAHVVVQTHQEAERLLQVSGGPRFKFFERVMNVSYEQSEKSYCGSKGDPDGYYERPSYSCDDNNKSNGQDDIASLCNILRARMMAQQQQQQQQGNEGGAGGLPDSWFEGGSIADAFHTLIDKNKKGKGCQMSDHAKERFKKARADAANQKFIEVGRRLKVGPRAGDIHPVGFKCDTSRYSGEIYIRLVQNSTNNAAAAAESDNNNNNNTRNLFVVGLPVGTDVRNFVSFLETTYKCVIQRAMLVAAKLNLCSAHIELASSKEAANLLEVADSGTGVTFLGGRLAVFPDSKVPVFAGNDLTRFYEAASHQPVPATIVSVARTSESGSISTGDKLYSDTQSQVSTEDSQVDFTLEYDDEALLCRVLHEQCVGSNGFDAENPDYSQWKAMGSAGSDFQALFLKRFSSDEAKQRFKATRENGISQGLVEMGRRDLRSPTKEVVLVPFYSYGQGSSNTNLSLDSYLRLTMKGIMEAEKLPTLKKPQPRTSNAKSKCNGFLTNLPRNLEIKDLVEYLEHTYKITIRRAAIDPLHPMAKFASVHVEFSTEQDQATIASVDRERRLVYAGKALRLAADRKIPNWASVDPKLLYELKTSEGQTEDDDEAAKVSMNTTNLSIEGDGFAGSTAASTDLDTTLETSNMLDNLSMLYAQETQQKAASGLSFDIDPGDPNNGLLANAIFPSHPSLNEAAEGLVFPSTTNEATNSVPNQTGSLGVSIPGAADFPPFEATDLTLKGAANPFLPPSGPGYNGFGFPLMEAAGPPQPQDEPASRPSLVPTEASSEVSPVEGLPLSPMESPALSLIESADLSPVEAPGLPSMETLENRPPTQAPSFPWS